MYEVTVERKRDGFKAWAAGSVDFDFSYSSAKHLVRTFTKRTGELKTTGEFVWENDKVKIEFKKVNDLTLTLGDWNRSDWYKKNL